MSGAEHLGMEGGEHLGRGRSNKPNDVAALGTRIGDGVRLAARVNALGTAADRIGASYLALANKIELQHNHVLTVLDRQGVNFEHRLDTLDSAVARLDERTRLTPETVKRIQNALHLW